MRFWGIALAALLTPSLLLPPPAVAAPLDPKILPAILVSAGRVDGRNSSTGFGSGLFVDANYTRTFLNGGISYKTWSGNGDVANLYVGTGISKLLQIQVGTGTQGHVFRVRHDLNLTSIYDFVTGTKRNRYNTSLGNRLTLTFAAEDYKDEPAMDNFHIGIGLLY